LAQAFLAVDAWAAPPPAEQSSDMAINYLRLLGKFIPARPIGRAD
jgi:hypothetical protein